MTKQMSEAGTYLNEDDLEPLDQPKKTVLASIQQLPQKEWSKQFEAQNQLRRAFHHH